jgi:hypothetical protein
MPLAPLNILSRPSLSRQIAVRAQKRSVADEEVLRYELYNEKHGAKYAEVDAAEEELEEW